MIDLFAEFLSRFSTQVFGGSETIGLFLAMFAMIGLLILLLAAVKMPIGLAFVIVSPLTFTLSLYGWLPQMSLGVSVLLVGIFWGGIVLTIAGK